MSEYLDNIPEGWRAATLPDLVFFQEGPGLRKHQYRDTGVPFLNIRTIRDNETINREICQFLDPEEVKERYKHFLLENGDIIWSASGTIGKTALIEGSDLPLMLNTSIIRFRPLDESQLLPAFLHFTLKSPYFLQQALSASTGTAQKNVGPTHLAEMVILVPPLDEQERIVNRLAAITPKVERATDYLTAIPPLIDQFRQSVLARAFTGELTADWRKANPDVEPASELLERIKVERREKWIENYARNLADRARARNEKKGASFSDADWQAYFDKKLKAGAKKYEEPEAVDGENLEFPELPICWKWTPALKVVKPGTTITYGVVKPGPEVLGGVPYVRGGELRSGKILLDEVRRMAPEIAAKKPQAKLAAGDVILSIIRHHRAAIVPAGLEGGNLTQGAVRMRPSRIIYGPYLALYLESPIAQQWMKDQHFGMSMPRINVSDAQAIPVPLASLDEQRLIVQRAGELLGVAQGLEMKVSTSSHQLEMLRSSMLSNALNDRTPAAE